MFNGELIGICLADEAGGVIRNRSQGDLRLTREGGGRTVLRRDRVEIRNSGFTPSGSREGLTAISVPIATRIHFGKFFWSLFRPSARIVGQLAMPVSFVVTRCARRTLAGLFPALCFLCLASWAQQSSMPSLQAAGGVQPAAPKFRLMRSISGSKGAQQGGRYVIEDPRTVFYVSDDRQVIVYFEWEGPIGLHHFEGLWKNPEGKAVVISDFSYEAKEKRFAGYWTLALGETIPTGIWTLEARVDGEVSGVHTFQIVAASRPVNLPLARRLPSASEIYQNATAASLFIQKLDAKGEQAAEGSGFFISDGLVLTAFQVIDGASKLRAILPDGRRVETNQVAAWNRRQDWAILKLDVGKVPVLARAQANSWSVGDHCYTLDSPAEGNLVIVETGIIGKSSLPGAGERINIALSISPAGIGSPLLNEYGDVLGVVGGRLIPGVSALEAAGVGYSEVLGLVGGPVRGGLAVPITLIPTATDLKVTSLEELNRTGEFVPLVTARDNVLYGTLAKSVDRKALVPRAVDQKSLFSRRDATLNVFVSWEPLSKIKGKNKAKSTTTVRVYDLDNRLRIESNPAKIDLKVNQPTYTIAEVPLKNLSPGIYRLDVFLSEESAWRIFFRVTE
jgi:S1-C subfamily serine protease